MRRNRLQDIIREETKNVLRKKAVNESAERLDIMSDEECFDILNNMNRFVSNRDDNEYMDFQ
jgi:hypothetical protein